MSKFTPGPWAVDSDGVGWYIEATPEREHSLAFIASPEFQEEPDTSASEAEANARLIAAAPDLLKALRNLLVRCEAELADPEDLHEVYAARAAVARATGEQA